MKKEIKSDFRVSTWFVSLYGLFFSNTLQTQNVYLYNKGIFHITPDSMLSIISNIINQATGLYTNDGKVLLEGNFHNEAIATFTQEMYGYAQIGETITNPMIYQKAN